MSVKYQGLLYVLLVVVLSLLLINKVYHRIYLDWPKDSIGGADHLDLPKDSIGGVDRR
jgi:hypothetical protein